MSNTQYDNLCGERSASAEREIIRIDGLNKAFGEIKAVRDLSFRVCRGELFAFLGVNGAGKSTTISIISGQLRRDGGSVTILGMDAERDFEHVSRKLGVVFQNSVLDQALTVRENLRSRAALYGINGKAFKKRLSELSELLDFGDLLNRTVGKLSGGQRRRIDIARALLHEPEILILDEPTTGLDPQTRLLLWSVVMQLRAEHGLTVFLTTHYMEEAQNLCNRVALMDHGKLEEVSTPQALIESLGAYAVDEMTADGTQNHYFHTRQDAIRYLEGLTGQASLRETTLEDVFVERAGKHLNTK